MSLRFARRFSRLSVWGVLGAVALTSLTALAYIQMISDVSRGDVRLRWFTTKVDYVINRDGTADIPGEQEFDAVRASFQTWENVSSSFISFSTGELTDAGFALLDGQNTVTIEEDPFLGAFGVLGYTVVVYWLFDGEIIESDIVINDSFELSLTEETSLEAFLDPFYGYRFEGVVNFPDVMTHEIGHFCGLDHTFVDDVDPSGDPSFLQSRFAATMYPYVENAGGEKVGRGERSLELDDEAGLSHIYPNTTFATSFGVIEGTLTNAVIPGEPVFGAHIIAMNADEPYYEAVSTPTFQRGNFRIDGLPPGRYIVLAEPMQDPYAVSGFFESAELDFIPEYYALDAENFETDVFVPSQATVIDVAAGEVVRGINFDVFVGFSEGDPNEDPPLVTNNRFTTATVVAEDTEILAVIDPANDVDYYRFSGDRGDVVGIEVIAQRIGSRLQPRLSLFGDPASPALKVSEDFPGLDGDARIVFELPVGGSYYVKVEDRRGNLGGEAFVYVLRIQLLSRLRALVAKSDPESVLGIPMGVPPSAESVLEEIIVQFMDKDEDNDFGLSDFLPVIPVSGRLEDAGIAVYDDSGLLGNGEFTYDPNNPTASDKVLPLDPNDGYRVTPILGGFQIKFRFQETSRARVPQAPDEFADFFVVVRTSGDFHVGDDFQVSIPPEGIVVRDGDNRVTFFPESFPSYSDTFVSDPIRLVNFTEVEQRIDVNCKPPAVVLGIDGQAPAAEEVVLSQLTVTCLGYGARLIPGAVYGAIADVTSASADYRFEPADLASTQRPYEVNPEEVEPGGISVYRDSEDPRGEIGIFDPTTDFLLAVTSAGGNPVIEEIPAVEIPAEIIQDIIPTAVQNDPFYQFWLEGGEINMVEGSITFEDRPRSIEDLIRTFNIRAFKYHVRVALPEADEDVARRALIPSDNVGNNRGADFFVTVSTSERIRGLDTFVTYIAQDDVEVKTDLGRGVQRPIPSLAKIDTRTRPEHVNLAVCRPRPRFQMQDLARFNRIIKEREQASPPKPVIGINACDFGQNFNIIPLPGSGYEIIAELGVFFNQSPVLDAVSVRLLGATSPVYNPRILQGQYQYAGLDNELGLLDHGVSIWMDDDTPIGNFEDDDDDGLIDEEIRNLIDDDLDGVIDEDLGDDDGVGTNGVFDVDIDDPLPYYLFRRTYILNSGQSFFNNTVTTTDQTDGSRVVRIPLLQTRVDEIPIPPMNVNPFFDPMTSLGAGLVFVRPDFLPIWYSPAPTTNLCPGVPLVDGGYWNFGFYIDCENLDDIYDLLDLEYTYSFVIPIPDEDRDFLAGDDFFVVLRTGFGAEVNDEFRIQIPGGGLQYSVYQNASTFRNNAYPGSAPDANFGGQTVLIVGHANVRPSIAIIAPGTGDNYFEEDHLYTVRWVDADPDDNAMIDLFLTDQRGSLARVHANYDTPIFEDDIRDQFTIDIADPELAQALSDAGIYPTDEFDTLFVVAEIRDLANDTVIAISEGPIRLNPERFQPQVELIIPATGEVRYFDQQLKFDAIRWRDKVTQKLERDAIINLYFNFGPQLAGSIPITNGQGLHAVEDVRYLPSGATQPASVPGVDEFVFDLTFQELAAAGVELRDLVNRPIYIVIELDDRLHPQVFDISDGFLLLNADTLIGVLRYEKMLNTGAIIPSFGAPKFPTPDLVESLGVFRFFEDMEIAPDETGAVVTNTFGMTVISGAAGVFSDRVSTSLSSVLIFDLEDLAPDFNVDNESVVDVEVGWATGFVLLGTDRGRVVSYPPSKLKKDNLLIPTQVPVDVMEGSPNRVVDMELLPDEEHLVLLLASGGFWWQPDDPFLFPEEAYVENATNRVDFALTPSGNGGIVLTATGEMIEVGEVDPALSHAIRDASNGGWLADGLEVRNAEITVDGTSLVVMDSEGKVHAFGDVRLPPDRDLSRGFQDIELFAQGEDDVLDVIKRIVRAYRNEDVDTLIQLTGGYYRDVHGRDANMLRTSLRTIFDFYAIHAYDLAGDATPCFSDYGVPFDPDAVNPEIVVRSDSATAAVKVCQAASIPVNLDINLGSESAAGETELVVPFTQTVTIFEAGDGRGDGLEIYDLDNPTLEFDRYLDRRIFDVSFVKEGPEGPWTKTLHYEGITQDNTYVVLVRQDPELANFTPPEILFTYYPEDAPLAYAQFANEYTFIRDALGFRVTGYQTLIDLPTGSDAVVRNAGRVGFSFQKGGPVVTLRGDEADFVFTGTDFTSLAFAPPNGGLVDITYRLGFTGLDRFRYDENGERLPWSLPEDDDRPSTLRFIEEEFLSDAWVGDLSLGDFVASEPVVLDHIYLVRLSNNPSRFGLVQPRYRSSDGDRLLIDWFYSADLLLSLY